MQHYYEVYEKGENYYWKIYHYDSSGNKEILVAKGGPYTVENNAWDDVSQYLEDHSEIDATLS